ncbi:Cell division control protein 4 [Frankliniella fusca]|uniref:Cell division control protein 4 n=1 Tax=Frankliniella fusca TaxID=407009 RepID=A0AAE1HNS3_9NEOP|nr:Cell division control protein 4 [Frankliniella fusca]
MDLIRAYSSGSSSGSSNPSFSGDTSGDTLILEDSSLERELSDLRSSSCEGRPAQGEPQTYDMPDLEPTPAHPEPVPEPPLAPAEPDPVECSVEGFEVEVPEAVAGPSNVWIRLDPKVEEDPCLRKASRPSRPQTPPVKAAIHQLPGNAAKNPPDFESKFQDPLQRNNQDEERKRKYIEMKERKEQEKRLRKKKKN